MFIFKFSLFQVNPSHSCNAFVLGNIPSTKALQDSSNQFFIYLPHLYKSQSVIHYVAVCKQWLQSLCFNFISVRTLFNITFYYFFILEALRLFPYICLQELNRVWKLIQMELHCSERLFNLYPFILFRDGPSIQFEGQLLKKRLPSPSHIHPS